MKDKFTSVYSVFISCIYLFALSYFGYNLYNEYTKLKNITNYRLNSILITNSIKISFLIILAATILTFIILFLSKDEDETEIDEPSINEVIPDENIKHSVKENENNVIQTISTEEPPLTDLSENTEQEVTAVEAEVKETTPVMKIEANEETVKSENSVLPDNDVKPAATTADEQTTLFSTITGFGYEQYLLQRLDSELQRAISSEQDLSLFVIKIPELTRESNRVQEICKYLSIEFQFKDLIFEYSTDCFAAIKNQMNIDEAISFAEKIQSGITKIIDDDTIVCKIGISAKTVRIINGERLLSEASEALKHAEDDIENPIIAFRANAEKYLKLIQKQ